MHQIAPVLISKIPSTMLVANDICYIMKIERFPFKRLSIWLLVLLFSASLLRASDTYRLKIWEETASLLNNFVASFETTSRPTQHVLEMLRSDKETNSSGSPRSKIAVNLFSSERGLVTVSRENEDWRFDLTKFRLPPNLGQINSTENPFDSEEIIEDEIQVFSSKGLFFMNRLSKRGAFRAEWPDKPENPIGLVISGLGFGRLDPVDEDGRVWEAIDKERKTATLFHLSEDFGMMPKKIEYFTIHDDNSRFLFRIIEVAKYRVIDTGAMVPEEGVIYDLVYIKNNEITWQVENRFKLLNFKKIIDSSPDRFTIAFPAGTKVTDYTLNIEYLIPEDGQNPIFSIQDQ